jgi:Cys-tRNA(Pro)/Cys-tRNA(Cys) deacylase
MPRGRGWRSVLTMTVQTPVSQILTEKGIPHGVFVHPGPLRSLEQAAKERCQRPEQVVRSLLFRVARDEYVMVLVAGPDQVDWKALRQHLGVSRITMATKAEVLQVSRYELGAVAPFGLPQPVRVLVDQSVLAEADISMGSGVRGVAILLKSADLLRALGQVEMVNVRA